MFPHKPNKARSGGLKTILCPGAGVTALASCAAPACAQEDAAEETRTLQAATVTATKREQTLQDVPIAVSVVGVDVIEKAEIADLGDLQSTVPSLRVGQLQSSANTSFDVKDLAAFVRADWQYDSPVACFDAVSTGFSGTENNALLGCEKEISTVNASAVS